MNFCIACGGTGGHIYPGIAVGQVLRDLGHEVAFAGTATRMEAQLVPREGFPFHSVTVTGLQREKSAGALVKNIKTVGRLAFGLPLWESRRLLKRLNPEVVIGTGGYVCGPVLLAARSLKIPSLAFEINRDPGLTNRLVARFVSVMALAYEASRASFPKSANLVVTGSPVRPAFLDALENPGPLPESWEPDRTNILVVGGSLGALAINKAVTEALGELDTDADVGGRIQVIHVVGERFAAQNSAPAFKHVAYRQVPYLHEMPQALAHTSLAICRAGAGTLAELAVMGVPSILLPWAGAANDHQRRNAETFAEAGAAEMFLSKDLTGKNLAESLRRLLGTEGRLEALGREAKGLGIPEAAERIAELAVQLGKEFL